MTWIDHIDLSVGDHSRSLAFYQIVLTALGFRKVADQGTIVWRAGDLEIGLRPAEADTKGRQYDRYRPGMHHLAFKAESRDAVDEFFDLLIRHEIEILDPPAEYPDYGSDYYAVFFTDPDGMKLEYVYRTSGD